MNCITCMPVFQAITCTASRTSPITKWPGGSGFGKPNNYRERSSCFRIRIKRALIFELSPMMEPEPVACAMFLMTAFVIAGFVQSYWLRSEWSKRFRYPIDGGRSFRGHRIFGDNKTWRGFVAIVPSVSLAFVAVRLFFLLWGDFGTTLWPNPFWAMGCSGLQRAPAS